MYSRFQNGCPGSGKLHKLCIVNGNWLATFTFALTGERSRSIVYRQKVAQCSIIPSCSNPIAIYFTLKCLFRMEGILRTQTVSSKQIRFGGCCGSRRAKVPMVANSPFVFRFLQVSFPFLASPFQHPSLQIY